MTQLGRMEQTLSGNEPMTSDSEIERDSGRQYDDRENEAGELARSRHVHRDILRSGPSATVVRRRTEGLGPAGTHEPAGVIGDGVEGAQVGFGSGVNG